MSGKWFKKYDDSDSDASGSSSDSDSDSDSSGASSSSSSSADGAPGLNAWLKKKDGDSDSDSDGEKVKVKSKKSKNEELMDACITAITQHLHNQDWNSLLDDIDKLQKLKARGGAGDGGRSGGMSQMDAATPGRLWLKGLKAVQDFFVANDAKEIRKKLQGKPQGKPFGRFHQMTKKLFQDYEQRLSFADAQTDRSIEVTPTGCPSHVRVAAKVVGKDEGSITVRFTGPLPDGVSDEQSMKKAYWDAEARPTTSLLNDFKVEAEQDDDDDEELGDVDADDEERAAKSRKQEQKEARQKKKEQEEEEWTPDAIERKLEHILAERGKKSTDRNKLVDQLKVVLGKTQGMPHVTMRILSVLLGCQMDLSESLTTVMPTGLWRQCYDSVTRLMNLQQENPKILIVDNDDRQESAEQAFEGGGGRRKQKDDDGRTRVEFLGTFHQIVERLGDEYIKSLQQLDPHTQEYVTRLRDEAYLLDLAERVFIYYRDGLKSAARQQIAARIALRLMDHLHYRHEDDHKLLIQKQRQLTFEKKGKKKDKKGKKKEEEPEKPQEPPAEGEPPPVADEEKLKKEAEEFAATLDTRSKRTRQWVITEDIVAVIKMLHLFVQKHGAEDKFKTKSVLMYIYHLALHDKYSQARDLLLMSRHNAENNEHLRLINSSQLMITYNRVLAQIGLAAFRAGEMYDCNCALNELCSTARTREYLAQTVVRSYSRDKVEENAEKARLVPFHMHINVDLLDGVHLIAGTLQEVPVRAQYPHDSKHRPQSKALTRLLHAFSHQVFLGPPETTKEIIYAGFNRLTEGNWKEANRLVMSLNCWNVMRRAAPVKAMITERIKVCALRTYLFTFSRFYASVQLNELASKYELPEEKVHSTVSRMIIRHEINAAWDQPKQCIRVESTNATKLQYLALQLADRCNALVEYNEQRQAEKEARGDRGFNPYQQKKSGGRSSYIGNKWESGAAGASRSATTTFKYNRTQERDRKANPFAKRRWG